jgi:hypothetical protein
MSGNKVLFSVLLLSMLTLTGCGSFAPTVNIPVPVAAPAISPAAGAYTSIQTVTITDATSWASIY